MDKKKLIWSLITIVLAVCTIWAVFSQAGSLSVEEVLMELKQANLKWLLAAVLSMLGFIFFEAEAILSILRKVGYHRSHPRGFLYAAGDVYFSAITPSASGGQPASAYFMMKTGIPASVTTAVLVMNLVMYTLGILTVGLICMYTKPEIFFGFNILSRILIVAGYVTLLCLAIAFVLVLIRRSVLETICVKMLGLLHRIHLVRKPDERIARIRHMMDEYQDCVVAMSGHKSALFTSYLWNLLQRISQILVTVFMYLATGGTLSRAYSIWVTQSMVAIGSNTVPIPGGMGVADYLMIDGFRELMSEEDAFKLALLSRSLSFYTCVLVSGITVAIGYYLFRAKRKRMTK